MIGTMKRSHLPRKQNERAARATHHTLQVRNMHCGVPKQLSKTMNTKFDGDASGREYSTNALGVAW
jgi:hypothetical protein